MRVTTSMMMESSKYNLMANKAMQDRLYTQGSTHKKIIRPSDDPVIAIRALRLRGTLNELTQYLERNVEDADAWLDVTHDAVKATVDVLDKFKAACVGIGGKGTEATMEDRQNALESIQALRDQIYDNGNADYSGRTLFTGYRTGTALSFKEETTDHYKIPVSFTAEDIEQIDYIQGKLDLNNPSQDWDDIVGIVDMTEAYRIRLPYGDLMATPPTIEIDGNPVTPIVTSIAGGGAAQDAAYAPADNAIHYIPETGELILGKDIKDNMEKMEVTFEKEKWAKGDLRPEHYFAGCESITRDVQYDTAAADQKMEYDVSFNQRLQINTTAEELFTHDIGRDVDELANAVQAALDCEEKIKKLEAMKNDPNADQAKVEKMLEAANKEMNYHVEKITRMFNTEMGKADEYYARANKAQARVGGRGERVDIVRSRLTDQYASFEDLASENENIDIEKVAMDLMQADMIYNSALLAIGKIANYSLLDYI